MSDNSMNDSGLEPSPPSGQDEVENKKNTSESGVKDGSSRNYNLSKMADIVALIKTGDDDKIGKEVGEHVKKMVSDSECCKDFNCVFLFDNINSMDRVHAEKIYLEIDGFQEKKDVILFLRSLGGKVEPAYLISKLCNRYKKSKFIVSIPAEAKSAATLLSLGADEIHMGPMSELGPIDPQVDGLPLLSVPNALEKIASIVEKYPASAPMFSSYLKDNLKIGILGYYDRIAESASQYAQRLLKGKSNDSTRSVEELASHFTNHYKDHRFVIDVEESKELLGGKIVKDNTDIYKIGSKILSFLNTVDMVCLILGVNKKSTVIGSGCEFILSDADYVEIDSSNVRND